MTSDQLTELALTARTDSDALNRLIVHETRYVTRWVRSKAQKNYPNDVEDIVQEILIRIADSIFSFEGRSSYYTWSGTVIRWGFICWLRRRSALKEDGVNGNICTAEEMEEFGGCYEVVDRLESEEVFDNLVELARAGNRNSLRLRFSADYLIDEIAEFEGVGWYCANDRVRRGLAQIKRKLEASHEEVVFDRVV